jgi:hypothetical protein
MTRTCHKCREGQQYWRFTDQGGLWTPCPVCARRPSAHTYAFLAVLTAALFLMIHLLVKLVKLFQCL